MKLERLPKSRTENLVVHDLTDEVLTYDLLTHQAYCLNKTSAIVYNACDGITTFEELGKKHNLPQDLIYLTLDLLRDKNLLADKYDSIFAGVSRREVIKKIGLATMIALPMISGLVAPTAANAASNTAGNPVTPQSELGKSCGSNSDCRFAFCVDTRSGQACCAATGGPNTLLTGTTVTLSGDSDVTYNVIPIGSPLMDYNGCQNAVKCCSGSAPSGYCSYSVVPGSTAPPGMIIVRADECVCSC